MSIRYQNNIEKTTWRIHQYFIDFDSPINVNQHFLYERRRVSIASIFKIIFKIFLLL